MRHQVNLKRNNNTKKKKMTSTEISHIHNLGILQKDIQQIIETYKPYDVENVNRLNTEYSIISNNDVISNYK
jgi:hypothetical protein